jgi:pyrroloquinoline quinone (PQQ) biosynthesis protein C
MTLQHYIETWATKYSRQISKQPLFDPRFARNLGLSQIQAFIKYEYHIRGNFFTFLWFIGSLAPDIRYKKVVMGNIQDEFGSLISHEQWYLTFAEAHGVDLSSEITEQTYNIDFIKTYNRTHIEYIIKSDFDLAWAIFCAYEKLDNVDYPTLQQFAKNIGTKPKALTFFRIHCNASHYDNTSTLLEEIWTKNPELVMKAFDIVASHQLKMWKNLYNAVKTTV